MMPRVAITGGSVGGLTAALVLRDAGCDVTVFERSSAALQARGAGPRAGAGLPPGVGPSSLGSGAGGGPRRKEGLPPPPGGRCGAGITHRVGKDSHLLVYPTPGRGGLGGVAPPEGSRDGALTPG